jgi:HTH-type transcriptional regulator, transcriptional repressor of NAD biosynthesis genes
MSSLFDVPRIVLVGAESTGKSTVGQKITQMYPNCCYNPEYLRDYCMQKITVNDSEKTAPIFTWTPDEFIHIAEKQGQNETLCAQQIASQSGFVVCDTDVFAVSIWYERYIGHRSRIIEKMAEEYDSNVTNKIYFLFSNGVPFVQDGYRDGEQIREWMFNRFLTELQKLGKTFYIIDGTYKNRFSYVCRIIDNIILPLIDNKNESVVCQRFR